MVTHYTQSRTLFQGSPQCGLCWIGLGSHSMERGYLQSQRYICNVSSKNWGSHLFQAQTISHEICNLYGKSKDYRNLPLSLLIRVGFPHNRTVLSSDAVTRMPLLIKRHKKIREGTTSEVRMWGGDKVH